MDPDIKLPTEVDEEDICFICHELLLSLPVMELSCGHKMHTSCGLEWYKCNNSCPLCRKPMSSGHDHHNDNSPDSSVHNINNDNNNSRTYRVVRNQLVPISEVAMRNRSPNRPPIDHLLVLTHTIENGDLQTLKERKPRAPVIVNQVCRFASKFGQMHILKWAITEADPPFPATSIHICANLVLFGNLEDLIWATEHSCPLSLACMENAARHNYRNIVVWLREHGCAWDGSVTAAAAEGGHLEMLEMLREQNPDDRCPWDTRCCNRAAQNGNIQMLKWLRDPTKASGVCAWGNSVCYDAIFSGNVELAKWAYEEGAPLNKRTVKLMKERGIYKEVVGNSCNVQ